MEGQRDKAAMLGDVEISIIEGLSRHVKELRREGAGGGKLRPKL